MQSSPLLLRALLLLISALAAGCATSGRFTYPPPGERAEAAYREALEAVRKGESGRAEELLLQALQVSPRYVMAHREYQNLLTEACRRRELFQDYGARLTGAPEDPVWLYLYGRLLFSLDDRQDYFADARRSDHDFAFAHYGLGFNDEIRRDDRGAARHYRRAIELQPRQPFFLLRLGGCLRRLGDLEDAREIYGQVLDIDPHQAEADLGLALVARDEGDIEQMFHFLRSALTTAPDDGAVNAMARRLAEENGALSEIAELVQILEEARARGVESVSSMITLAKLSARLGRSARAALLFGRAAGRLEDPATLAEEQRLAEVREGRYRRAWQSYARKLPPALLDDPENRVTPRYRRLERALSVLGEERPEVAELMELGRAAEELGWTEEALSIYSRVQLCDYDHQEAGAAVNRVEAHHRFLRQARSMFLGIYEEFSENGSSPDLDTVAARLMEIGRRELDFPEEQLEFASFAPLGRVWSPSRAPGSALTEHLKRLNLYGILGQRIGGPPELHLATMSSYRPSVSGSAVGRSVEFEEIISADTLVPGFQVYQGQGVAGVAVVTTVLLDLDAIWGWVHSTRRGARRWSESPDVHLETVALPAASSRDRLRVAEPLCLSERLAYRAAVLDLSAEDLFLRLLSHVRDHEMGHVLDAGRYLPVSSHPFRALGLLISEGLSSQGVLARLEGNAEAVALARSEWPRLALSLTVSNALGPGRDGPHAVGYRKVLEDMIQRLAKSPAAVSNLDAGANLLQQLDRLAPSEVRDLAAEVARDRY